MKNRSPVFRAFVILITLAPVGPARADREKAKSEFADGVRHYDLNEFSVALEHFRQAYLEYEEPRILFNIGQCYRQLGDKQQAVLSYRSYLRKLPDAPNADEVKQRIATLETEIARDKSAPVPRLAATPSALPAPNAQLVAAPPPRRTPVYKKWWLWTAVGVGVAAVGVGLGLGLSSHGEPTLTTVRAMP